MIKKLIKRDVTTTEILFSRTKDKEALQKKLNRKFIRINTCKENYDADYEIGRIQTILASLKNKN